MNYRKTSDGKNLYWFSDYELLLLQGAIRYYVEINENSSLNESVFKRFVSERDEVYTPFLNVQI